METIPTISVKEVSLVIELGQCTVQRIIRDDLTLKAYALALVQNLMPENAEWRLTFCDRFLDKLDTRAGCLDTSCVSDKSTFPTGWEGEQSELPHMGTRKSSSCSCNQILLPPK